MGLKLFQKNSDFRKNDIVEIACTDFDELDVILLRGERRDLIDGLPRIECMYVVNRKLCLM